jgi:hypothetical protein
MKLEGERFGAHESVFQGVCNSVERPPELRVCERSFITPQGNLAIGVSEIRTCPDWGPDMSSDSL